MKRTPAAKRQLIVHLLKEGLSTHEVAARAKVHQSTVSRIKRQENIEQKNVKRGRPRIVSDRIAKKLSTKVRSGELQNAVQARKFLEETTSLSVSTQTVRNVLAKDGLEAAPKIEKPKISKANMKKRLEFARKHQYWTSTGPWTTGSGSFGLTKARSTAWRPTGGPTAGGTRPTRRFAGSM